jgi:tetratricopeptide (TPR) repeat protein
MWLSASLTIGLGLISLQAPALPSIALDHLPPAARASLAQPLSDASAHPDDVARVGALALRLHAWEQWDAAADVYARACRLQPAIDWCYGEALVATRLKQPSRALDALRLASATTGSYLPAQLLLADTFFDLGRLDEARRTYEELTGTAAAPAAHYGIGRALAAERQPEAALVEFESAIRLFPEFAAAHYGRGLALRDLGRVDAAQEALAKAREYGARWPALDDPVRDRVAAVRDDARAHLERGIRLDALGDLNGAIHEHEASLRSDPQLAQATLNLISLYARAGRTADVETAYRKAVALGSNLAEAHYNYGVFLTGANRIEDADRAFTAALASDPHYARASSALGQLLERRGLPAEAESRYRRALVDLPGDRPTRFSLARLLIARGALAEAAAELKILVSVDDAETPRYLFALAAVYVRSGDVAGGRRMAEDARARALARGQTALATSIEQDLARLK